MKSLESTRLLFRQWKNSDFPKYAEFYSDEKNAKYVGGKKDKDTAWRSMAQLVGHWHLKGFGYWAVEEKTTGSFVGCVGLWQSPGWPELELGYWLTEEFQGKAFAYEAAQVCKECARDKLKAKSLVSYIAPDNKPSIGLAKKLGATYEKTIELLQYGPHCVYRHF